jgi:sec-independent protein translocase protein TatA
MFGHWAEILVVVVIGLLVFGPKRVIEMGSSFGKAFREFRQATRGLSWSSLTDGDDMPRPRQALPAQDSGVAKVSQFTAAASSVSATSPTAAAAEPPPAPPVVEGSVEHVELSEDAPNL